MLRSAALWIASENSAPEPDKQNQTNLSMVISPLPKSAANTEINQ
ncbi:MAG: hypothetical protein WCG98_07100 [bacterium]